MIFFGLKGCIIFLIERFHYFFLWPERLQDFFLAQSLHDFFDQRGCFFWPKTLHDYFLAREVT